MRPVLFFICGMVLANIVAATFIWPPSTRASGTPEPVVNTATRQGQDPWMVNERYNVESRDRTRKGMLETLDKPWASYCTEDGHEHLIRAINNYYGQREAQAGVTEILTARTPGATRSAPGPRQMTTASSA